MKNIKTLSELEDKYIGKKGTPERTAYEKELADLMIGYQVKNARIKLDLTQEELAERIHKKRSFISRVENDGSNLTIKTLREIVEKGLGGKLNIELNIYFQFLFKILQSFSKSVLSVKEKAKSFGRFLTRFIIDSRSFHF